MKKLTRLIPLFIAAFSAMVSCVDTDGLETRLEGLEDRVAELEKAAGQINANAVAAGKFARENVLIIGFSQLDHSYQMDLSDGTSLVITDGITAPGIVPVIGLDAEGNWIMSIDNGETFTPVTGAANAFSETGKTPIVKVDNEGFWLVSIDGGNTYERILGKNGKPISATDGVLTSGKSTFFNDITYDKSNRIFKMTLSTGDVLSVPVLESFYIKLTGYIPEENILLNQTLTYKAEMADVAEALFQVPEGWHAVLTDDAFNVTAPSSGVEGKYTVCLVLTSSEGYILKEEYTFTLIPTLYDGSNCKVYNDWMTGNEDNVLLDFSYAGYNHGETAPPEAAALGYTIYNVTDYGAVPNDGKSDRDAFLACVEAATGVKFAESAKTLTLAHKEKANAIVYFPEGEFILHSAEDNYTENGVTTSRTIQIRAGNFVLRGAGRDKTTLVMQDPNLPTDATVLYSSPSMIDFKHNSGLGSSDKGVTINVAVTENAAKGSFSVEVESTAGLAEGLWVCLSVQNNDPAYVAAELKGGNPTETELAGMTDIVNNGVKVTEYHKIRSISGNTVTFYEPIHKDVDISYTAFTAGSNYHNWKLLSFPHYENVGIEDLTFKGYAKGDFKHHGSWEDDGAYKPLNMTRLTDSWLRRVRFSSVSEACSVINSSNVSVYDVIFDGNRGHSSIRSQQSTRVFIGATVDKSDGPLTDGNGQEDGAGQYHAVGVSKPSIGAVLWRNSWGSDSCFESHATQPRATLIDCCQGGWVASRQGGDANQVPNHLDDLTIWNFKATNVRGDWTWWDHASKWHKFLPPTIVGFHGASVTFDQNQVKLDFSNGTPVYPESLYEAQLKKRLGAVPAWLESLK